MKTLKLLTIALAATALLTACNNAGNNQQQDSDTTYTDPQMEPAPPVDTLSDDTLINDTL